MNNRKSGAPKGGRVHWLLWNLSPEFKNAYRLYYDYDEHNYVFERRNGRKLYDVFIVKQTSIHYWRMMYANVEKQKYECFGYQTTRILAEFMMEMYLENKIIERKTRGGE